MNKKGVCEPVEKVAINFQVDDQYRKPTARNDGELFVEYNERYRFADRFSNSIPSGVVTNFEYRNLRGKYEFIVGIRPNDDDPNVRYVEGYRHKIKLDLPDEVVRYLLNIYANDDPAKVWYGLKFFSVLFDVWEHWVDWQGLWMLSQSRKSSKAAARSRKNYHARMEALS